MDTTENTATNQQAKDSKPQTDYNAKQKQRSVPPRSRKGKRNPSLKYTPADCEKMYLDFCKHRSMTAITRNFKVSRTNAYRIMRRDRWLERAAKVDNKSQEIADKQAVKAVGNILETARKIMDKTSTAILNRKKFNPSVAEYVKVVQLITDIEGTSNGHNVQNDITIAIMQEINNATDDTRRELIGDSLRAIGIRDTQAVSRIATLLDSKVPSQN